MKTSLFLLLKKEKREKGKKGKKGKREKGKKGKMEKGKKGKREDGAKLLKLPDFSKDAQKIKRGSGALPASGLEEEKKTEKAKK